jgi:diacylglycerol kinase (ATP)
LRVSLFHNEDAGYGTSLTELTRLLQHFGHEVVHVVDKHASADQILEIATDLVVAAGGDGTVAAAARALMRRDVPLAILPLGTANNVAKSLGCDVPAEQLIEGWDHSRWRPLDLGIARADWGEQVFLESVGAGLIPAGIIAAETKQEQEDRSGTSKPDDASRTFRDVLADLQPRRWTITVDGIATTGDFLLVEILNMPSIGPNLVLAQDANPSDGFFSVVIATESHRQVLDEYLEHRGAGGDEPLALTSRHARHIEIRGWSDVHVDDQVLHTGATATVSIDVEPAAVVFLTGPPTD